MTDLNGKILLVTGAAGAIGSAVTQAVKAAGGTAAPASTLRSM